MGWTIEKIKFPAPKRPLRARQPNKGLEKLKKSNFQLPKGPCGHDNRTKGLKKKKSQIFRSQKAPAGTTTGQRAWTIQKVKFSAPRRPLRAWHQEHRTWKIPYNFLYFQNIKAFPDSDQKTTLRTRFWNLFEHNWPLIGPLDFSRKRNILTFEGASRGIGKEIQKEHCWQES